MAMISWAAEERFLSLSGTFRKRPKLPKPQDKALFLIFFRIAAGRGLGSRFLHWPGGDGKETNKALERSL